MKLANSLEADYNQLLNPLLQNLSSDPTPTGGTKKGLIWINTTSALVKHWDGAAVQNLTNLLEGITGSGAISVGAVTGKSQAISIVAATAGVPGTMSASDYSKLAAATNANTASAIVSRDGSGNFIAGTITAALTGTASNATNLNSQAASWYLDRTNHTSTQLASTISNFDTQVRTSRLDQMAVPTASVVMNTQKITGLLDPTSPQDAATKNYVDSLAVGLDIKASVRVASVANVPSATYSATGGTSGRGQITTVINVIDGVTLVVGNRVLLKNQTTGAQNGIWSVTTVGTGANGVWDRATDFNTDAEATSGSFMFIEEGTQGATGWVLTTVNPIVIGGASGTSLVFAQFNAGATYAAGNGLNLTTGTFSVVGTSNRISVSGSGVDIASTYVGQTSITTLGTVTTGTWNGVAVDLLRGGTGGTTVATAKTSLGFMSRFAVNIGDGANGGAAANGVVTSFTVTHTLGTLDVQVELQEIATGIVVYANVTKATTNTLTVAFSVAPPNSTTYRCIVIG